MPFGVVSRVGQWMDVLVWRVKLPAHHLRGQRLSCRTTDVGGLRQDRPSGAEADRSGV